jgi:hypothetical protein
MANLKKGDRISLANGGSIEITKKLGEGGQGTVYRIEYSGQEYALKWYKSSYLKDLNKRHRQGKKYFRENLEKNISKGSPNDKFLWPVAITEEKSDCFGYIMKLRPAGYFDFSDILNTKDKDGNPVLFKSFRATVESAMGIVNAFGALHRKGYFYLDLNDGNFFINTENGDVLICDNDNVTADPNYNLGKPGYIAPELVRGDKDAKSNALTDAHSLAVVLFKLFMRHDPLMGKKKEFFYNEKLKEFLDFSDTQTIMDLLEDSPDANAVMSYISGENAQSQGVLSEMYSVVREILIGVFAEKGAFSMREFVRNKGNKTLFIEYDLSIGSMLTPVYRLMFDLALKEALGRSKPQGNVYLICDEFKLLPHLRHIDDGVNFGRSLGVKVFAGVQSIEQLYEIYGQSRGRNIAAGFSSVYAFRSNDTATRDYVSGIFGKNILLEQYQRLDNQMVEEKRNGYTVEDWDLNSLAIGEAIVGLPFAQPFRFQFDMYR